MIEKENRNWNEMFGAIPAMGNIQQQQLKIVPSKRLSQNAKLDFDTPYQMGC